MKNNVILIMTDQHRFDCLGCYNNKKIETPNIDWIASEGTLFSGAYTPSPSCIPARACLMSGMTQWNSGILGMGHGQEGTGVNFPSTLPGELAKHGYYTKGVGKMHFHPQRAMLGFHSIELDESGRNESTGFISDYNRWVREKSGGAYTAEDHGIGWNSWMARPWHLEEHLHPTAWTVTRALQFLNDKDPSMPFFLKISFERPHSPYDPPEYYYNLYKDRDVAEPFCGDWAACHDVPEDAAHFDAWRGKRTNEETTRARQAYYGSISFIDNQLGRLYQDLQRIGELENTMFIFTSDHGDMLGDHNLWRKTYAYEGSSHIPFIIKLPKNQRDNVVKNVDSPVTLYDIMPTILDFAGVPIPDSVDGKSLMPLIKGECSSVREFIHSEHCAIYAPEQEMQFITDGKLKFVWLPYENEEQFFDLQKDPKEETNLIGSKKYEKEVSLFKSRLCKILEDRNNNTSKNGELICQKGCPPQISPHYKARRDSSEYKW